jgi:L-malate glycosyltransferase
MQVLHINSEYTNNPLYKNLVAEIDNKKVKQLIYATIKSSNQTGKYELRNNNIDFYYSKTLKKYHRLFYFKKIHFLFKDLLNTVNVEQIKITHAHKLFSDGGVAYKLFRRYKTPYIVAIRNTDINVFLKYMKHVKPFGKKILDAASQIILISPSYKEFIYKKYPKSYPNWSKKTTIIPNGIDQFWFDNLKDEKKIDGNITRLLFCGKFTKNKNIEAIIQLLKKYNDGKYIFRIVGGGGNNEHKINELAQRNVDYIEIYPFAEKNELLSHYKASDIFIMPSFRETFGLSYIEAMTQGLPVIYSNGQGIDGYFKNGEVGYAVNPNDIDTFFEAIKQIENNYNTISKNCVRQSKLFNWNDIAEKYISIYNAIV